MNDNDEKQNSVNMSEPAPSAPAPDAAQTEDLSAASEVSPAENTETVSPDDSAQAPDGNAKKRKMPRGKLFNALKVFGFLILVLAVNAAMYFGGRPDIPGPTRSYRTYQLNRMFSERRNSIDVVYVGHSGVHCGVSPMEIYDEYGIAGYSLSQPLMLPWESYETVVDLLQEQDLKVIALEVNAFFYDKFGNFFNSYAKRFTLSAFPFYESHNYWKDGFKRSARDPYKNFPFYKNTVPYNGEVDRSKPQDGVYKMHGKHMKYLKKYVELCRERGIELFLFELPVVAYWSWQRHNCIAEFAEKNGLEFFDMNVGEAAAEADIDFKRDFMDGGDHLNFYGAKKASLTLGKRLREKYSDDGVLPYRKGTPEYGDWDSDLELYRKKAENYKDREITDVA